MGIKNLTFEKAVKELEEISKKIQNNETSLDESLKLYERGSELKKYCENYLNQIEVKLEEINNN